MNDSSSLRRGDLASTAALVTFCWLAVASLASCSSDPVAGSGTSVGGRASDGGGTVFGGTDVFVGGMDAGESSGQDGVGSGSGGQDSVGSGSGGQDGGAGGGFGSDATSGPVGDFGKPCKADADCESGFCVKGYAGFVCTQTCDAGAPCPSGHACTKVALGGGKATFLCLAQVSKICHPCSDDLDCSGGSCVDKGGEKFCAPACGDGAPACPNSHTCASTSPAPGAPETPLCMPTSGSCECTSSSVGLVRACQKSAGPLTCYGVELCGADGWSTCGLPDEICDGKDNNCDGNVDEGFVDGGGGYTTVKACGVCGNDCTFTSYVNASVACDTSGAAAACVMVCNKGAFDVDDNPKTGCECIHTSNTDLPDGTDHNCDGVDGEVANGVFVAKVGKAGAKGTLADPVASIGVGIGLAATQGKRDVYVATGVYDESLLLVSGVSVYGGYSADFRFHDAVAYETVLVATAPTAAKPGAINGIGITAKQTIVDGITTYAANVKAKGASTYGLYLRDCDASLTVRASTFVAGDAGAGKSGDGGNNGVVGVAGQPGKVAKDLTGKTVCSPSKDQSVGGNGGSRTCAGKSVSGGKGGTAICPAYNIPAKPPLAAENGTSGKGSGAGKGGIAGLDGTIGATGSCTVCSPPKDSKGAFLGSIGLSGSDGSNGSKGGLGAGCEASAAGSVDGLWVAKSGAPGGGGGAGGGGGGGGAGGGVLVTTSCTSKNTSAGFRFPDVGGSGGGGGSGGCGGTGGKPGTSGGASFAAFVVHTKAGLNLPVLLDNTWVTGNGGEGGQGGQGGVGGVGGDGKLGGADDPKKLAWCAGSGGRGGQGGNGGNGGGGGGGCGGDSWGLYVVDAAGKNKTTLASFKAKNAAQTYGQSGDGGQGGKSPGNDGGAGDNGASGHTNF